MKSMAEAAELHGKKNNHSGRKTMLTRLVQKDVPHLHVAQLSGHKNLKSIDSYATPSSNQQREMSYIISGKSQSPLCDRSNFQHATTSTSSSVLPGLTVSGNQTVNMYFGQISTQVATTSQHLPLKRRHAAILDSNDEDM